MPITLDHVLAFFLLVLWPAWIARRGRDDMRELAENPDQRLRMYWTTIAFQWGHFLAIAGLWLWQLRSWRTLGFGFDLGWGMAVATVLAGTAGVWMWRQRQRVQDDAAYRDRIREQAEEFEGLLPRSPREVAAFRAMAVTAGVCEETAYRGYLLWYLSAFVPLALAIPLAVAAFGAAHLYQGIAGAMQVAVVGMIMMLLFLLSGSLWLPVLLHVIFDLHQLAIVFSCGRDSEPQG